MPGRRLKRVAAVVVILGIAGSVFEQIGRYRDRNRFKQIGRSVNIGGRTLNLSCLGRGSPTVVFDTYGHQSGYSWVTVQSAVAKYTRACWYDRAGYGWSELGPSPRTSLKATSSQRQLCARSLMYSGRIRAPSDALKAFPLDLRGS